MTSQLKGAAALAALEEQGRLFAYATEVAAVFDRDPRTIYDAIRRGEIPHTKIGQHYHVPMAWLREAAGLAEPERTPAGAA